MSEVECLRVGTRVQIAEGITGLITAICVRNTKTVTYEVAWWNGRDQRIEWFSPWQVKATENEQQTRIGFIGQ